MYLFSFVAKKGNIPKIKPQPVLTIHYWESRLYEDNKKTYLLLVNVVFLLLLIIRVSNFTLSFLRQLFLVFLPICPCTLNSFYHAMICTLINDELTL